MRQSSDIVVIGGGAGGVAVALAASAKRRVAVIDEHGTACPSQLETVMVEAFVMAVMGGMDFPDAIAVSKDARQNYLSQLPVKRKLQDAGVAVLTGKAQLISGSKVEVGHDRLMAKSIVIATGSEPVYPTISGWSNQSGVSSLLTLKRRPERIVVIGYAREFAPLLKGFTRLGTRVTATANTEMAVPIEIRLASGVVGSIERLQRSYRINLHEGAHANWLGADVVVAVGKRQPKIDLNLDQAGVSYRENGIIIDRRFRTTNRHIYAVGDCAASTGISLPAAEQGLRLGRQLA